MFGAVLNASEQVLATITTDIGSDRYQFIVEVDEERRLLRTFLMENLTVGESHSREAIPIESFLSGGLVLPQNGNIVFAKINGHHFDRVLGGGIVIDVLHNGITGKRKYYELELAQEQSGWKLFYKGKSITSIKAIANKIPLFGVVGARELLIL